MIDLVINNFTKYKGLSRSFWQRIIIESSKTAGFEKYILDLSINLVGDAKMKSLNKKYRGKNLSTDVLSFPLKEKISIGDKKDGIISLGDIFICLPVAKKHAAIENVGLDFKVTFLAVHGFLHLLGFDHEKSPTEERRMFYLQDKILLGLGYSK
ncbi:MAG TPA: rRNA maturation RNase YbeY [Candidatus Paceibacterota bacterium]